MKKIAISTVKGAAAGAGIAVVAGFFITIFVGIVGGFLGMLASFGGAHDSSPDTGSMFLLIVGIGAAMGAVYGLFSGVGQVRNDSIKRSNPTKDATYDITFSAGPENLPDLIKLVSDQRLTSLGAVIISSEVRKGNKFDDSYTYNAVIQPDTIKRLPDGTEIAKIPGQETQLVTRRSISNGSGSLLVDDCCSLIAALLPPGPSYSGPVSLSSGSFTATIPLRMNGQQAEQLKSKLPAQFTSVS